MKDNKNFKWSKRDVAYQYKKENLNWSWNECWRKADLIYKELKRLNNELWYNNKMFFKYNTPFSFFDNKDSEFSDIPWDGKWE